MDGKFFPSTAHEALALLYVKLHATKEASPEELHELYQNAYKKISDAHKAERAKQKVMY